MVRRTRPYGPRAFKTHVISLIASANPSTAFWQFTVARICISSRQKKLRARHEMRLARSQRHQTPNAKSQKPGGSRFHELNDPLEAKLC